MAQSGGNGASAPAHEPIPNAVLEATSFLFGHNAPFIEDLYANWQSDPTSVDESWREFFAGLRDDPAAIVKARDGASWKKPNWPPQANGELVNALDGNWAVAEATMPAKIAAHTGNAVDSEEVRTATLDSIRALMMIRTYRVRGHLIADLDPLKLGDDPWHSELDPATYGFTKDDWDRPIFLDYVLGLETATIREILSVVRRTYCGTLGVEFMHIADPEQKAWVQHKIEGVDKEVEFTSEGKRAILNKLIEAESFEKFLNTKYTGTKRFGLDGGEALIPAMEAIIKTGGQMGIEEIVLGMAHRGRLNVLANVLQKPYRAIFNEFRGGSSTPDEIQGSGDVKYHLGTSADRDFDGNIVHLSLTANPSHLEAVDPVVLGKVRAKQFQRGDTERQQVLPLLLHGDAAFAGQGIVAECFGMSGLKGHRTGGTIHIVVNNQIGFTTSPIYSRSSPYPSDVAKMVQAPIFHCNGDDPESVVHACKLATEFRQKFHCDVVVDMFCYRRFGHNEGDEPSFTQPIMYRKISKQPSIRQIYADRLVAEKEITQEEVDRMQQGFVAMLEQEFEAGTNFKPNKADWLDGRWAGLGLPDDEDWRGKTGVKMDELKAVGKALTQIPDDFNAHRTIHRLMKAKEEMIESGTGIDWATGEALAFGTLVREGFPVRLSGQDSGRGTFSQRHSVLVDQETEERYEPLNNISPDQAPYEVIDSMLSEAAVLGFEYGYSLAEPNALVLWEAQFGDFANGAQVIIDQFVSAGERKWLRMSGLTLLLPHGYEGQGPEHSSARLERYLQVCAEDNMQVANCTTPANYFHILRRQIHRRFRKPLVIMTPKSLLRHKLAKSNLVDMGPGTSFHRILTDRAEVEAGLSVTLKPDSEIKRVVLCTGKVYFDLFEEREKRGIEDVQIIRVEQLYPFPYKSLIHELNRFPNADVVWCQEEPKNMGAWFFVEPAIEWCLERVDEIKASRAQYAGRDPAASPATGLMSKHLQQQAALIDEALTVKAKSSRHKL